MSPYRGLAAATSPAPTGRTRLQRLGRSSVVVCAVTLSAGAPPLCFPALPAVLLAAHRGGRISADVVLHRAVDPAEVLHIAVPGDPGYDAHPTLPRA